MTRRPLLLLALPLVLAALACGGDSTAPQPITGVWDYSVADATDGIVSCDITGVVLTLEQDGAGVSGQATGGSVMCEGVGGGPLPAEFVPPFPLAGQVLGTFSGGHIALVATNIGYRHDGALSGFTLSGPVEITDEIPDGVRVLNGTYTAVRR